jgi:hypothetical protein
MTLEDGLHLHSEIAEDLKRERWERERTDRKTHEQQRAVIARGSVEAKFPASHAPMDEDPLAVAANGDGQGLHRRAARGVSITRGVVVDVATPQARRAMVAVTRAWRVKRDI